MKKEYIFVDDREGNAVAGAEVYIKDGGGSLVTIYSDNGVTTQTNPMTTDNDGKCDFYVADGTYTIEIYIDGVVQQSVSGQQIYDETDAEISAIRSLTSAADKGIRFTGSGTAETFDLSDFALTFLDDADAATVRTTIGAGTGDGDLIAANDLSDVASAATARANLGVEIGADVEAWSAKLDSLAALSYTGNTGKSIRVNATEDGFELVTPATTTESFIIACSDETTALTTGTAKVTFRMPYAFTVTAVYASLTTAQTSGSIFTVDINEAGTSILSTKLTIDNTETDSATAATAAVISDASLAARAQITVDIDQVGDGTAKGLKVTIVGHQ